MKSIKEVKYIRLQAYNFNYLNFREGKIIVTESRSVCCLGWEPAYRLTTVRQNELSGGKWECMEKS